MDVARFHRGALRLQTDKVDLTALLGHAIESVRPNIDKRGHQLHVDLPPEPIVVDGDGLRLNQVFMNILDNAIKYTGRDGTVSLTARQQANDVEVRIRDNGPGISEAMLPSVFEMFSQASGTLDQSSGGLGIGLFLVKQLVAAHGGTVEAHSDGLGQGSEFVVTLPALADHCPQDGLAQPQQPSSHLARHRVVIVDDVKEAADALAKILGSIGQDATPLYDGESAIPWILEHAPDVVFLDIAMPGLNGYEVARRLRGHRELRTTLLIALTSFGQPEDKRRALESGFHFHMTKPAKLADLEALLLELPRGTKATAAATLL
jgi:CheY-like chemotaxis protein/two-component sensor histidine kinase